MFVVTPQEMTIIDKRAIEEYGIPGIVLMENAALQAVNIILSKYDVTNNTRVLVIAGSGNNGGDGLAVARHLFLRGCDVNVVLLSDENKVSGDARINLDILKKLGILIKIYNKGELLKELISLMDKADIIVDAILGTGLTRNIEGPLYSIINEINIRSIPVVAVDIPSGINGENGSISGIAINADHTIAFGYPKRGHLLYPGRSNVGELHVVPISLPGNSAKRVGVKTFTLDDGDISRGLLRRSRAAHKGDFGRVGVIAGSPGMTGAAVLTAKAALSGGAGLVTLAIPAKLNPILSCKLTEVMTYPLPDKGDGEWSHEVIGHLGELINNKSVLAVGPGLGKRHEVFEIIRNILDGFDISIVLDADGLNHISKDMGLLKASKSKIVITPHPGEMARLTGKSIESVLQNPIATAVEIAMEYDVIVVLKGATTVVANPKGDIYLNTTGCSGMATAGSGDVLTGLIASFIAQGYGTFESAVYAVYIHGRAGELAGNIKGEHGMTAGDILEHVPVILKRLYENDMPLFSKRILPFFVE